VLKLWHTGLSCCSSPSFLGGRLHGTCLHEIFHYIWPAWRYCMRLSVRVVITKTDNSVGFFSFENIACTGHDNNAFGKEPKPCILQASVTEWSHLVQMHQSDEGHLAVCVTSSCIGFRHVYISVHANLFYCECIHHISMLASFNFRLLFECGWNVSLFSIWTCSTTSIWPFHRFLPPFFGFGFCHTSTM
jgi:hypothetical protein